jgi:hypothetical protein
MRSSRRSSAVNRRNSIAGRWRPWLWETAAEDAPANDSGVDGPSAEASREQISLWADDTAPTLGPSTQLRLE